MQAAADWIIRQRNLYMKDILTGKIYSWPISCRHACWADYAIPSSDWRWYYTDNAFALKGLQRFADALMEIDPEAGRKYGDEAEAFRSDIRWVIDREAALAPVRLGRDGMYHSFIPIMIYAAGLMCNLEFGAPQRPQADIIMGALSAG